MAIRSDSEFVTSGQHRKGFALLKERTPQGFEPKVCVVLGSGWSSVLQSDRFRLAPGSVSELRYAEIDGLGEPDATIGHPGRIACYYLDDTPVLVIEGRLHLYDTLDITRTATPHWIATQMGVQRFVLTCAAGAVNAHLPLGALVRIKDHDTFGFDPFYGVPRGMFSAHRFNGMNSIYSARMWDLWRKEMSAGQLFSYEGVYAYLTGPSYETPTEIRRMRAQGIDLVGMSLSTEAAHLHAAGAEVFGVACVTNAAATEGKPAPNHEEVTRELSRAATRFETPFLNFLVAVGNG